MNDVGGKKKKKIKIVKPGTYMVDGVKVVLFEEITEDALKALVKWTKKYG